MRFTKGLGYGLAGVLLAGMLLATAISTAEGQVDDSPMTIPAAREGDEVVYASFSADNRSVAGHVSADAGPVGVGGANSPGTAETTTEAPEFSGFIVPEITTMADRTGMIHDVVRVDLGVADESSDVQIVQYIDLETRDVIRADLAIEDQTEEVSFRIRQAIFGPNDDSFLLTSGPEAFRYQGLTIHLGQDLSDITENLVAIYEHAEGATVLHHRTYVAERAYVDGEDAYGIRTELRLRVTQFDEVTATVGSDGSRTVTTSGPTATREVDLVRTEWVTATSPYPVFIEETSRGEFEGEAREETSVRVLAEYRAGDRVIPWGVDRATQHYRSSNEDAERQRSEFPADGTGSSLGYGLGAAVEAVENDPTLLNFQLWRQQNPGHRLVGMGFVSFDDDAGLTHQSWSLVYGVTSGDGYAVRSERIEGVATPRNEDLGGRTVESFAADQVPSEPLTLGAVERLWASVASDRYTDRGPNRVEWGFVGSNTAGDPLGQIVFGHESQEAGFPSTGGSVESSTLTVDLATGNLVKFSEVEWDWEFGLLGTGASSITQDPSIRTKTIPAGVQPPEVEEAALVTTSLLAVFLAAYFWPVLKYGAGAAFLGGYAKIKKDKVLDNEVRAQIHQAIQNDPGVNASEVGRRVDAGWGTVVYHLRVLEKNGYVSSLVDGRHKRFFPVGEVDWSKRGQIAALRNPKARTIYEAIAEDPGIIQGDLAGVADISVPAAIWHLKRLEDAGLVGREKKGRKVHYYANEAEEGRGPEAYDPDDAVEVA